MNDWPVIKPVCLGVLTNQDMASLLFQRGYGEKADFPCIIFAIQIGSKTMIVDTGPCDPARAAKYHTTLFQDQSMEPVTALKNAGIDPADVELVVFSHLHWDHVGNNGIFKNANFLVQRTEIQYAVSPCPIQNSQYDTGFPDITPLWMGVFPQIHVIEGDYHDIVKGVHLITLPGHTPGLMGVAVETQKGVHVIASDAVPLLANWEGDKKAKHIPSTNHINLEDFHRSFQKMEKIADVVIGSHDPLTMRHPQFPVLD